MLKKSINGGNFIFVAHAYWLRNEFEPVKTVSPAYHQFSDKNENSEFFCVLAWQTVRITRFQKFFLYRPFKPTNQFLDSLFRFRNNEWWSDLKECPLKVFPWEKI